MPSEADANHVSQVLHNSLICGRKISAQWLISKAERRKVKAEILLLKKTQDAGPERWPGFSLPSVAERQRIEEDRVGAGAVEMPRDLSSALGSAKLGVLARLPVAVSDIASFIHSIAAVLGSSWERLKHDQVIPVIPIVQAPTHVRCGGCLDRTLMQVRLYTTGSALLL